MHNSNHRFGKCGTPRRGAALMFCMFILVFSALIVTSILDATTLELAALRNTLDYERALYLANAGVHEVAAILETDINWRGVITDGAYPADNTYTATAVDGINNTILVSSTGVAGDVTRNLQATIE